MALRVCAIAAMDEGRVIGAAGKLPWHLPEDLKRFSALTTGHAVLMGRKTYESLPPKFRPLPKRLNIVASRSGIVAAASSVQVVASAATAIADARRGALKLPSEELWVIGGAEIYAQTVGEWDELFLTLVHSKNNGDAFFPKFEEHFELKERDDHEAYSFLRFVRARP